MRNLFHIKHKLHSGQAQPKPKAGSQSKSKSKIMIRKEIVDSAGLPLCPVVSERLSAPASLVDLGDWMDFAES
jgi:hypothetical protein